MGKDNYDGKKFYKISTYYFIHHENNLFSYPIQFILVSILDKGQNWARWKPCCQVSLIRQGSTSVCIVTQKIGSG